MCKPVEIKALENYQLWIKYSDGTQGTVDLSHLAGRGVFALWDDYDAFRKVVIGSSGEIAWSDRVDLCPDSIYMKISGKRPEELFPNLAIEETHA
jgi:hypothetical protein